MNSSRMPGFGDEATWPPFCGDPRDPRYVEPAPPSDDEITARVGEMLPEMSMADLAQYACDDAPMTDMEDALRLANARDDADLIGALLGSLRSRWAEIPALRDLAEQQLIDSREEDTHVERD